jgi:hypothetical protein
MVRHPEHPHPEIAAPASGGIAMKMLDPVFQRDEDKGLINVEFGILGLSFLQRSRILCVVYEVNVYAPVWL